MSMNGMNEEIRFTNSATDQTQGVDAGLMPQKKLICRQQASLDYLDWDNLPMPALTSLKARTDKRNGKYKKKSPNLSRPWKEQTKICAQKLRHADAARSRRIALDAKRKDQQSVADTNVLALA